MPASMNAESRLFPVVQIRNGTDAWRLAAKLKALLEVNQTRAVDLVLIEPEARSRIMYSLAVLAGRGTSVASQVLPRQRDRRARVRVIYGYVAYEDPQPAVFKVTSMANVTLLAEAMRSQLMDAKGENLARTVRLEFMGRNPAAKALLAIEQLFWEIRREITFVARFEKRQMTPAAGKQDPEGFVHVVTVTST